MALAILILGSIVMLVGGVMFLIAAFSESVLWGLGCMFVPFVSLFFLILHWPEAKKGFFIQLAGAALVVISMLIGIATAPSPAT
jgi:hypothetical protein